MIDFEVDDPLIALPLLIPLLWAVAASTLAAAMIEECNDDGGVAIGVLIGNVSALCEKADLLATLEAWY